MRVSELYENDFDLAEYGYWIDSDGKVIPIDEFQGHYIAIKNKFVTDIQAFRSGWIAVVAPSQNLSEFSVEYKIDRTSERSIRSLVDLIKKLPEYEVYIIDYGLNFFQAGNKNSVIKKINYDFFKKKKKVSK